MLTVDELKALGLHEELQKEVQMLLEKQDKLIEPLVKLAMMEENIEKAQELIGRLPTCFHKLELKAWLNLKRGLVN